MKKATTPGKPQTAAQHRASRRAKGMTEIDAANSRSCTLAEKAAKEAINKMAELPPPPYDAEALKKIGAKPYDPNWLHRVLANHRTRKFVIETQRQELRRRFALVAMTLAKRDHYIYDLDWSKRCWEIADAMLETEGV